MSSGIWQAQQDLAQLIADSLLKDREDSESVGEDIACAIRELIECLIEDKVGTI